MPQPTAHWLILMDTGRTIGPYSTESVQKLIVEGAIDERCRIKQMGTGAWQSLQAHTIFFDSLLAALGTPKRDVEEAERLIAETLITPHHQVHDPQTKSLVDPIGPNSLTRDPRDFTQIGETPRAPVETKSVRSEKLTLTLQNLKKAAREKRKSTMAMPALLISASALVLSVALYLERGTGRDKLRLIAPNFSAKPLANFGLKDAERQFSIARAHYWRDTVESYVEAQSQFVALVEAAPNYLPARGYLCLVYRELWPYVQQTKGDLEVINSVTKSTKLLDPAGPSGAYCEIARMLTQGKLTEARGMIDYFLERADSERQAQLEMQNKPDRLVYRYSTDPIIMSIRAELLSGLRDDVLARSDPFQAALYVENIQKYSPHWVKMYYLQAHFLLQAGQAQRAAKAFESTLKINPQHKPALIEYGVMHYTQFRQADRALNYLSGALNSRGVITRQLEARANYTLARIWSERRSMKSALEYAQRAYELNPADNQIKNLVLELGGSVKFAKGSDANNSLVLEGDQHSREGDCMVAQGMYKAAYEADPGNGLAAMKAAKCLKTLNRPLEAILWLQKALKADPKLATAYLLLADYYSERFDFRRAEAALNEASSKFPNQYEILRGYGLVSLRQNRLKQAIGFLTRALRGYENDTETLILLARAHLQLGQSLNESDSLQKSLSYSARALELDRANVDGHVIYAQALAPFKGLESALSYLTELKNQFSRNIEYPLAIADLLRQEERCKQAIDSYRAVIEWKPETKEAHMGLAQCLYLNGEVLPALKSYYDAAYYDTSDPEAFIRIGLIFIESGKFTEAVGPLKKALEANEATPLARVYLGRAYLGLKDYSQALNWAKEEIQNHPKTADGYILAAQAHAKLEDYKACAEQYQVAVGLRDFKKQKAELFVSMARCQRQSSNLDGAQGSLDIALTMESGNAEIYKEQGALFEARGDGGSASAAYGKYLQLSPNAPDRREIEARVGSANY